MLTALYSELLSNLELADDILSGTSEVSIAKVTQRRFSYPASNNLLMLNYATLQDPNEEEMLIKFLRLVTSFMAIVNKTLDSITFTNTFPQRAIADIHTNTRTVKNGLEKYVFPAIKKMLDSIRKGGSIDSPAPIILPRQEYQRMLDSSDFNLSS
jgi:hypothetical protein